MAQGANLSFFANTTDVTGNINTGTFTVTNNLIVSSGSIGIGTTSPTTYLDVSVNSSTPGGINCGAFSSNAYSGTGVTPSLQSFGARNDGNATFQGRFGAAFRRTDGTAISSTVALGMYAFGGQWGTDTSYQSAKLLYPASIKGVAEGSFTSATAMPTAITFSTGSTGDLLGSPNLTYGTERMRIDSNGNVGIGTTSPNGKLSFGTSVGTANEPSTIRLYEGGTAATSYGFGISSFQLNICTATSGRIVHTVGGTEVMRISASGGVYIGTAGTDPGANNLQVAGNATITGTLDVTAAATLRSISSTIPTGGRLSGVDVGSIKAPGTIVQVVYLRYDTKSLYAYPAYSAGTSPNGVFITDLATTITPKFSNSKIIVNFCPSYEANQDTVWLLYRSVSGVDTLICQNNTDNNRWSGWGFTQYDNNDDSTPQTENYMFYDTPGTTAAVTYKFYIQSTGAGAGNLALNRTISSTGQASYEVAVSQVFLKEVAQ